MKKLKLNMIVALLCNVFYILTGIVAQRFILRSYGSEINGLTGSINQFLAYFVLLEAGLGTASVQALYKPLAADDKEAVDGILSATAAQYKRIGILFLILTAILACAMPSIVNSQLDSGLIITVTMLMGGSSVLNYLFIGRYMVLLRADRKVYVLNILDSVLGALFTMIRIALINTGHTIVAVQSVALLSPLARIIVLRIYFRRNYSGLSYKARPDFNAISKRKFVFVHQIVGMIHSHTDVTLLTLFAPLSQVSVYTVYNLIYSNIDSIISSTFSTAVEPSFGRLLGGSPGELKKYYSYYELMFTFFLSWLLSATLVMTVPFVELYTEGVTGVNYIDPLFAAMFMTNIYLSLLRIPAIMMVDITGAFQETQNGAIIEAVINILVSIPAFFMIGMRGLLLGTMVSIVYRAIDIVTYSYRHVLDKKMSTWFRLVAVNGLSMAGFVWLCKAIGLVHNATWIQWLFSGVACVLLGVFFYALVFFVFYPAQAREVGGALLRRVSRRKAN